MNRYYEYKSISAIGCEKIKMIIFENFIGYFRSVHAAAIILFCNSFILFDT